MGTRCSFAILSDEMSDKTLNMILLHVCDATPATAVTDAKWRCQGMMSGIGSVSRRWRHLAKVALMGEKRAWLTVQVADVEACTTCFPRALSLRIVGDAWAGDIAAMLKSTSLMRLTIRNNTLMRGCEGLGQLVGLRDLYIEECSELHDAAALSSLMNLTTLHVMPCNKLDATLLAPSLARMTGLASLNLPVIDVGAAGAASLALSLKSMTLLTSLGLSYVTSANQPLRAWASLARSLALMAQLTSLRLGGNYFGTAGAASLEPSLAQMTRLTLLDLHLNDLGAAGATSLAPSLARMREMTSLNLHENHLGAAGATSSRTVLWFWAAVRRMTNEERSALLLFCTGSARAPATGFAHLVGYSGQQQRFRLQRVEMSSERFPAAATCFNTIRLPDSYTDEAQLLGRLQRAMREAKGFDEGAVAAV